MENKAKTLIAVSATIKADISLVWELWTKPEHITQWNNASDDWHTPRAENDLRVGGKFLSRMEAKDGSMGFDFPGVYNEVVEKKLIVYTIEDGRKVRIEFKGNDTETTITETFEAESINSIELQKNGWQAIMDNFKKYVETHKRK